MCAGVQISSWPPRKKKKYTSKKFDESVDISVVLGIDSKKSDQQIRGVLSLPKMPEKKIKVAVFADGNDQDSAKKAGAPAFFALS